MSRLDARTPLVLATHALDRRPGTMCTVSVREPAPADLSIEVIGVPEGADLELDLRLESVLEGILVSGTVRALAVGECARCLEPLERPVEAEVQELFAYPGHESEDTAVVEGELIDLEPTVRDAVVIALPLAPLCRPDCPGLCAQCGAPLVEDPQHSHDTIDQRWAALQHLDLGAGADLAGATTASGHRSAPTYDDRRSAGGPKGS